MVRVPIRALIVSPLAGGPSAFSLYALTEGVIALYDGAIDPVWKDWLSLAGMGVAFGLYGTFFAALGMAVLFVPVTLVRTWLRPDSPPRHVLTAAACGLIAAHGATLVLWPGTLGNWQATVMGLGAGATCGWVFQKTKDRGRKTDDRKSEASNPVAR